MHPPLAGTGASPGPGSPPRLGRLFLGTAGSALGGGAGSALVSGEGVLAGGLERRCGGGGPQRSKTRRKTWMPVPALDGSSQTRARLAKLLAKASAASAAGLSLRAARTGAEALGAGEPSALAVVFDARPAR
jgi:hypothetical protein